jgi:hypothetical protein
MIPRGKDPGTSLPGGIIRLLALAVPLLLLSFPSSSSQGAGAAAPPRPAAANVPATPPSSSPVSRAPSAPAASSVQAAPSTPVPEDAFAALLREADLALSPPAGWREIPPPDNELFDFDRAWQSPDGAFEIRVAVRPLARMVIDYEDPHSSAPDPNDIHPLAFTAMIGQFARQGEMPARELPRKMARREFNADWAALAAFGADRALNTSHSEAMLLGLHKDRTADVYILFLYDDPARAREVLKKILRIARFRQPTPEAVLRAREEEARRARDAYLQDMREAGADRQCVPPAGAREVRRSREDLDQTPQN